MGCDESVMPTSSAVTLFSFSDITFCFSFCARWQRSAVDANKRSAEQDAFEDFALELCAALDPVYQVSIFVDCLPVSRKTYLEI